MGRFIEYLPNLRRREGKATETAEDDLRRPEPLNETSITNALNSIRRLEKKVHDQEQRIETLESVVRKMKQKGESSANGN